MTYTKAEVEQLVAQARENVWAEGVYEERCRIVAAFNACMAGKSVNDAVLGALTRFGRILQGQETLPPPVPVAMPLGD